MSHKSPPKMNMHRVSYATAERSSHRPNQPLRLSRRGKFYIGFSNAWSRAQLPTDSPEAPLCSVQTHKSPTVCSKLNKIREYISIKVDVVRRKKYLIRSNVHTSTYHLQLYSIVEGYRY